MAHLHLGLLAAKNGAYPPTKTVMSVHYLSKFKDQALQI
jgi:hypothetical protein